MPARTRIKKTARATGGGNENTTQGKRKRKGVKAVEPDQVDVVADFQTAPGIASGSQNEFTFEIQADSKPITAQRFGQSTSTVTDTPALIFTHGAGGGIQNPASSSFAKGFARNADVLLFQGTMNLQSRVKSFNAVIEYCHGDATALGGRSMGARAAVIAAKEHDTKALVLVSYPLTGQNGKVRDEILLEIDEKVAVLFVLGAKDEMCDLGQLNAVRARMKADTWLCVVEGADHGMSVKPKRAVDVIREYTGEFAAEWLQQKDANTTESILAWDSDGNCVKNTGWHLPPDRQESVPSGKSDSTETRNPASHHTRPRKRQKKS